MWADLEAESSEEIQCVPQCQEKQCGPDGCGAQCGFCVPDCGMECRKGQCEITFCENKQCGKGFCSDCGTCPQDSLCIGSSCLAQGTDCDDGNSLPWDGCTLGNLTEFQVADDVATEWSANDAAALDDGAYVVIWQGELPGQGPTRRVLAAVFGPDGLAASGTLAVNEKTTSYSYLPEAAGRPGGGFFAAWQYFADSQAGYEAVARAFAADAMPLAAEAVLNVSPEGDQRRLALAALADGNAMAAWDSCPPAGWPQPGPPPGSSGCDVRARLVTGAGAPSGAEFQINEHPAGDQTSPALSRLGDASFVAVWQSCPPPGELDPAAGQDGYACGVFGRIFGGAFPASSEFQINAWTAKDQSRPAVAALSAASFVAVWESRDQDGSYSGVFGRRFDSQGTPLGPEFQVTETSTYWQRDPTVAATAGAFVTAWSHGFAGYDGSGGPAWEYQWDIFVRAFDPSGVPTGPEIRASLDQDHLKDSPSVAIVSGDTFVVSWNNFGLFFELPGRVFAQRFSLAGDKLYH